jgi:hypothetical protein
MDTQVDEQLSNLETKLRNNVQFYLTVNTDREFWKRENKFRFKNSRELNKIIKDTFGDLGDEDMISVLQHCAWTGMNVEYPTDPDRHIDRFVDNLIEVYIIHVYALLRTKMVSELLDK